LFDSRHPLAKTLVSAHFCDLSTVEAWAPCQIGSAAIHEIVVAALSQNRALGCLGGVQEMRHAAAGDEARVVSAYPALRRFAFVVADSDTDPDDLLHDALVKTLRQGPLAEIDNLVGYVRRVMTNLASNHRRRSAHRRTAVNLLGATSRDRAGSEPERPSDLGDLMQLKPADRAALYLQVVDGYSHREIAEILGLTEAATRARVSRALKKLRAATDQEVSRGNPG
jgi:RNA polymerase sigma factor (sigma-70 family)